MHFIFWKTSNDQETTQKFDILIFLAFAGVVSATRSFLRFGTWAKSSQSSLSCMLILMNVQRQHWTFGTHQLFISTEMVRGLMRCLVAEKNACMTVCGCIRRWSFHYQTFVWQMSKTFVSSSFITFLDLPCTWKITISKTITDCILHTMCFQKNKATQLIN